MKTGLKNQFISIMVGVMDIHGIFSTIRQGYETVSKTNFVLPE
jgi:hypothetical protein